jgi:hypothetical protein
MLRTKLVTLKQKYLQISQISRSQNILNDGVYDGLFMFRGGIKLVNIFTTKAKGPVYVSVSVSISANKRTMPPLFLV